MCYDISYEPADIIIYVQGKGLVLKEKSLIAFQKSDNKIVAFGTEAEQFAGKGMDDIVVMSPLRYGMVADFTCAERMFSLMIEKALGRKPFLKPAAAVCVPKGITEVEKKALEEAIIYGGGGANKVLISDIPAEEFVREFPEKFPQEYRKFKIVIGITKDEPERYVQEQLKSILAYAGQEEIPPERVCNILQEIKVE